MTWDRPIPADAAAEAATLGGLLTDATALGDLPFLTPSAFHTPGHGRIYAAMAALATRRDPVDVATVASELARQGTLESVGGLGYLERLRSSGAAPAHVPAYARNVARAAFYREVIARCGTVIEGALAADRDPEDLLADALATLRQLAPGAADGWIAAPDLMTRVLDRLAAVQAGELVAIPTGWTKLDAALGGGWWAGGLTILAALTSYGKSAFALNTALAASRAGRAVAILSLEMSAVSLGARLLAMVSGVNAQTIRTGALSPRETAALHAGASTIMQYPRLSVRDLPVVSVDSLRAEVLRLRTDPARGADLVIVDYLQLLQGERRRSGTREQEVADVSRQLSLLALELDCHVLALSQFSRAAVGSAEPEIEHLRESGAIGQNAGTILFLHRPKPETAPERVDLLIRKQRDGPANLGIPLRWHAPTQRFTQATSAWEDAE